MDFEEEIYSLNLQACSQKYSQKSEIFEYLMVKYI